VFILIYFFRCSATLDTWPSCNADPLRLSRSRTCTPRLGCSGPWLPFEIGLNSPRHSLSIFCFSPCSIVSNDLSPPCAFALQWSQNFTFRTKSGPCSLCLDGPRLRCSSCLSLDTWILLPTEIGEFDCPFPPVSAPPQHGADSCRLSDRGVSSGHREPPRTPTFLPSAA